MTIKFRYSCFYNVLNVGCVKACRTKNVLTLVFIINKDNKDKFNETYDSTIVHDGLYNGN